MKRTVSLLLVVIMLSSVVACAKEAQISATPAAQPTAEPMVQPTAAPVEDKELQRAAAYGFIPTEFQEDWDTPITYRQFCGMLSALIEKKYDSSYLEKWESVAVLALASNEPMQRSDGALAIYEAALAVGMDDPYSRWFEQANIDGLTQGEAVRSGLKENYPLFPNWNDVQYSRLTESQDSILNAAIMYPWHRVSGVSGRRVMEYDDKFMMHYGDTFTREQAVRAVTRLYESWSPREFVVVEEAGSYNRNIITDEIIANAKALPDASAGNLPMWRGANIYNKGTTHKSIVGEYQESYFRFLSDNGFNFTRLFLSFTTLGYPDYPDNGNLVNRAEFEDIDQLIAWGMKYGVHVMINMLCLPGYGDQGDIDHQSVGGNDFPNQTQWDLTERYWRMLAERYKDIPNNYVSFNLCAEWSMDGHEDEFADGWTRIAQTIRQVDPDRLMVVSFNMITDAKLRAAESMAKAGIAIGVHPYYPDQITSMSPSAMAAQGYDAEAVWPLAWFPSGAFMDRSGVVRISGAVGGTELSVFCGEQSAWYENGDPTLAVYADGKKLGTHQFDTGGAADTSVFAIPEETKEIVIKPLSGRMKLSCLKLHGDWGDSYITPHDFGDTEPKFFKDEGPADLVVSKDGNWANAQGRFFTANDVYAIAIAPYREIAQKYGVDVMVTEFGTWALENAQGKVNTDAYTRYHGDMVAMFEKNGVPYTLAFLIHGQFGLLRDYYDFSTWGMNAAQEKLTYTYDNGRVDTFNVNRALLDVLCENMLGR